MDVKFTSTYELTGTLFWQVGGVGNIAPSQPFVWVSDGEGGFIFETRITASTTINESSLFFFCTDDQVLPEDVTVSTTEVVYTEKMNDNLVEAQDDILE